MSTIKSFETFVSGINKSGEIKPTEEPIKELQEGEESTGITNPDNEAEESIPVSQLLETCYDKVVKEAAEWESDAHDEHTVQTYMAENAGLVASLAARSLAEMKSDMKTEAYEACLNKMSESYSKKINEMKEMKDATDMEDIEL
jgi:hypothetical protein